MILLALLCTSGLVHITVSYHYVFYYCAYYLVPHLLVVEKWLCAWDAIKITAVNNGGGKKKTLRRDEETLISENNAQDDPIISLRAKIIELRSKAAEASAANINDCSTLNAPSEVEAKRNLYQIETQLEESRQKIQQVLQERQISI